MRQHATRSIGWLAGWLLLALWPNPTRGQFLESANLPTVMAPSHEFAAPPAPSDPRFFGTYCAPSHRACRTIGVLGVGVERCKTATDLFLRIDYKQTDTGGLIHGSGSFRAVGQTFALAVGGAVVETGLVRGFITVPGVRSGFGDLHLSSDAMTLSGSQQNEQIALRKDACGNRPPIVTLVAPQEGQSFPFGSTITFRGTVTDEDASIPLERMFFNSHRDGPLSGSINKGDKSLTLHSNSLSPGQHAISLIAIDSGGLSDSRTVTIDVSNEPPQQPEILAPAENQVVVAVGAFFLEGRAFDFENWSQTGSLLAGGSLVWSASIGNGPFTALGTGDRRQATFSQPGPVTLRLTATDSLGAQSVSEPRHITVQAGNGNTPPRVAITTPDPLQSAGAVAAALVSGTIGFVATVDDTEDEIDQLTLQWTVTPLDSGLSETGPPQSFGGNSTAAQTALGPGVHRITLEATDSGSASATATIAILVLSHAID